MAERLWIVIPRWRGGKDGFQHYGDRDPKWIKNYTRLLHNDDYLRLTGHRRALLHGLWLAYAMSGGCVAVDPQMVGRQLGLVVKMTDLEALNHAGFIHFSASAPVDDFAIPDKRREEDIREEKTKAVTQGSNERPLSNHTEVREAIVVSLREAS